MNPTAYRRFRSFVAPSLWAIAIALLALGGWNLSPKPGTPPEPAIFKPMIKQGRNLERLTTRVYDVHDLTDRWLASPYSLVPGEYGGGLSVSRASSEDLMNDLHQLVEWTLHSDDWDDNGGTCTCRASGSTLIVAAPGTVQVKVAELLRNYRKVDAAAPIPPEAPRDRTRTETRERF